MDMCKSLCSLHVADEVAGYCLQMAPGHTYHPLLLEGIGAQWYDWSLWPRDRPDLDVVACILAKTMAHPKIGDEWLVKRVCRYVKGWPRRLQSYEDQGEAQ